MKELHSAGALDRSLGWLLVWLTALAAVTLFPFDFRSQLDSLFSPNAIPPGRDALLNVLLFVPVGLVVGHRLERRRSFVALAVVAGAAGLLVSFAVETLQGFLPRRDSSLVDLALNTAGAMTGVWCHRVVAPTARAAILWLRARPAALVLLLTGFSLTALGTSGALQSRTRLSGWSRDYPLLVGNERTGERPWRGRLSDLELTDASTPFAAVRQFARGEALRLPGNLIASYDFRGDSPYRDAGGLASLAWTPPSSERGTPLGVILPGRPWLQTEQPVPAVADRLLESNAFTVRVGCSTDDLSQFGPARIVSYSLHAGLRNFTLGQQGDGLVFRFRSLHTDLNGARPEIVFPGVFSTGWRGEILVTYDGATLLMSVAGAGRIHRANFTPGSSLAAVATSLNIQGDDLPILELMYLAGLFLLPGAIVGLFDATPAGRFAGGALWLTLFTLLLEATLVAVSGRSFAWSNVFESGLVGGPVLVATVAFTSAHTERRSP